MSVAKGTHLGGIRTVEDLRQRSRVDEDTGCWHWGQSKYESGTARVFAYIDGERCTHHGRKMALLLKTGKPLPKGHVAFATGKCDSADCVNPEHSRSGSRANHGQYLKFSGKAKTYAKSQAATRTVRERLAKLTFQDVRAIRSSDESAAALAARHEVTVRHIWNIRAGRAWPEMLPAASVFSFHRHAGAPHGT